ncbi:MAG: glycoside hydrolase family 16 protein [Bacteroidales bacterium]|nr:glycoside hydrolase family 16 protein [Bacteroidales bacterium]
MKRIKSLVLATILAGCTGNISAQDYELVWGDEFDGNTLGTLWNVEVVANPSNNELQHYTDRSENVRIENGNLVLTARRENYGKRKFTSGRVNTFGKVTFTHGRIEARVKLPRLANGLWPAFWMMGDDPSPASWPACGEIDIFEAGHKDGLTSGNSERLFAGCLHWGRDIPGHEMLYLGSRVAEYDITGDYHIFSAVWDESEIAFYLDDCAEPYYTADIGGQTSAGAYFHHPFHILFNLAVGGDYPDIHEEAGITALAGSKAEASMYIDYVRVYQKAGARNVSVKETPRKVSMDSKDFILPSAPKPAHPSSNVIAIAGNWYSRVGDGDFATWSSPGESLTYVKTDLKKRARRIRNFTYVGYNIRRDYGVVDCSKMSALHFDVYVTEGMSIGVTPVSKDPLDDDSRNVEHVLRFDVQPGWNSIDVPLIEFRRGTPGFDLSRIHLLKWDGGNGTSDIVIDNVYFYHN